MNVKEIMLVTLKLCVLIWLDLTSVPVTLAIKELASTALVSVVNQKHKQTSSRKLLQAKVAATKIILGNSSQLHYHIFVAVGLLTKFLMRREVR